MTAKVFFIKEESTVDGLTVSCADARALPLCEAAPPLEELEDNCECEVGGVGDLTSSSCMQENNCG